LAETQKAVQKSKRILMKSIEHVIGDIKRYRIIHDIIRFSNLDEV